MLYNHRAPHTVQHYDLTYGRLRSDPLTKQSPHSLHYKLQFLTLRPISAGEEIFGDYGEEWFFTRGIEMDDSLDGEVPMHYESMEALQEAGHCLSDIEVKRSTIFGAGDGVFTRRSFKTGEIVSISPLVNIPKHILKKMEKDSVLGNYCFSIPESNDTFLPIGTAGMINHGGHDDGDHGLVNLRVEWYQWNNNRVVGVKESEAEAEGEAEHEVVSEESTGDSKNNNRAEIERDTPSPYGLYDFAYFATRDIAKGEELFISYGEEWEAAWEHYSKDKQERRGGKKGDESVQPLFRHFISL